MADDLLDRRLLVVTGKGGVGKSTVAAALGLLVARTGRRAVVAEVGRRGDVLDTLEPLGGNGAAPGDGSAAGDGPARGAGRRPAAGDGARRPSGAAADRAEDEADAGSAAGSDRFVERPITVDGATLWHVSVSPEAALREYLRDQLPIAGVADLLGSGKLFTGLTAATPGLRELLAMGKVWELAQPTRRTPGATPYDLCVMDAPASGHAVTVLGAARQFARTARVGPIARQGTTIASTLEDPAQTAVVIVTTAEELPVTEALELQDALAERAGVHVALGVVNGVLPDRFSAAERDALAAGAPHDPAIAAADAHARRAHAQALQVARLRRGFRAPVLTLPAAPGRRLGPDDVAALADRLAQGLRRRRTGIDATIDPAGSPTGATGSTTDPTGAATDATGPEAA